MWGNGSLIISIFTQYSVGIDPIENSQRRHCNKSIGIHGYYSIAGSKPPTQVIYSNVKEVVEKGQYIFDTLWNAAIPAEKKIREI
jgi:hypothetical protein